MKRAARGVGGLAAMALLAHCGGETQREESGGEDTWRPSVLEQTSTPALTFVASADADVEATQPALNFGGSDTLRVDLSPPRRTHLRFEVSGVTGSVARAKLRLYATGATDNGPHVVSSPHDWEEAGLTWNTAPSPDGTVLDDQGAIASGSWVEYDVTSAVRGNGTVSLTLVGDTSDGTSFASRESARVDRRPQLVITPASGSDCMPRTDTRVSDEPVGYDGYASQGEPTRRFGLAPLLKVTSAPERMESYLKFSFFLPQKWNLRNAKLRLYAAEGTSDGPTLFSAQATWQPDPMVQEDFDWNTRPGLLGAAVDNVGAIAPDTWVEYDVTSRLTTPGTSYAFGLLPESSDEVTFASKNHVRPPQVRLSLESDPYCTYRGTGGGMLGWTKPTPGR